MTERRTVITGMGPVTAIGIGREEWVEAWRNGDRGIRPIEHFDASAYGCGLAAEILDFDVEEYLESQKSYLDRATELAFAATVLAMEDAGLDLTAVDRSRVGLLLGSSAAGLETMALFFKDYVEKGPRLVKPFLFPHTYNNTAPSLIAIEFGLTGHHVSFGSGALSGACALAGAHDAIQAGRCELALAGGYEALGEPLHAAYDRMGALASVRSTADFHGPFDSASTGTVLGEGAAVLLLEEREHALARGAKILGEIRGTALGSWCEPAPCRLARQGREIGEKGDVLSLQSHAPATQGRGGRRTVTDVCERALSEAGVNASDLGCILASANGDPVPDALEADGLAALNAKQVPVTAPKSLTGETLGAGGAIQLAAALAVRETGTVAPNRRCALDDKEPGLRLATQSTSTDNAAILVTALDPGGSVAAMVVA